MYRAFLHWQRTYPAAPESDRVAAPIGGWSRWRSSCTTTPSPTSTAPATSPLIGATIGDLFDRVGDAVAGPRGAGLAATRGCATPTRELRAACDRFARGLLALGVGKGDRVGIWSPNHAEWVIAQFATPKIGAILVNINPAYRVRELEYALRQSGCSALIIAPPFKTSDYAGLLREVCPELRSAASRASSARSGCPTCGR